MDLTRLRTAQWLTIIGGIAGVLSLLALWQSPYRTLIMAGTLMLIVSSFLLELQRDRLSVLFAGITRLYHSFPVELNARVFRGVETEYCYLGVGFTTIMNTFRSWYESERKGTVRIRLLLTDPEAADVLEFQARYERNLLGKDLSAEERKLIDDTARRAKDAITLALDLLATLPPSSPPIELRFHREKLRKWMHFINRSLLYVGLLRAGESGLNSPVIVLKPGNRRWSLFDHYREEWESLWEGARPAELATTVCSEPRSVLKGN